MKPVHHSGPGRLQEIFVFTLVLLLHSATMAQSDPLAGAPLDVSDWAYRKAVHFTETGVIRVELNAEVLAHSALDLRDVRIMQEGRQLPYFMERDLPLREAEVKFQLEPD